MEKHESKPIFAVDDRVIVVVESAPINRLGTVQEVYPMPRGGFGYLVLHDLWARAVGDVWKTVPKNQRTHSWTERELVSVGPVPDFDQFPGADAQEAGASLQSAPIGLRFKHDKTGGTYMFTGLAYLQIGIPGVDGTQLACYRRVIEELPDTEPTADGRHPNDILWCRPTTEFCDGRFEYVPRKKS